MIRKSERYWSAAFAPIAMLSSYLATPMALADTNARDMFYHQLNEPSQTENTGMSYWIELRRNGKLMRVDSRHVFHTGDKIKFHITPNIDGHAHIVLLRGSSGAQSILFPVPGKDLTNVVHRGKDYAIPSNTFLVFDQTKGREHVRIALSRHNVATAQFLKPQSTTQIAMAAISSNPAMDPTNGQSQIQVSFPEEKPPNPVPAPDPTPVDAIPNEDNSRDLFREDSAPHRTSPHVAPRPHATSSAAHTASHAHHFVAHNTRPSHPSVSPSPAPPAIVVLNTNANEDLYADISLEHN